MNDKKKHIYLVDGSTYIFRAYHALPPLTRKSDGFPVGAISGFCNMLDKLIKDEKEKNNLTHLLVIFDASGKTFRNDIFPEYKANRSSPPEDLIPQFPVIRKATDAFNVPHVEMLGYEADDLIASYAKAAINQDMKVTIVSSDKDLMQLVKKNISMLDTMKNRLIKENEVFEKFGVKPNRVIDVQSLAGDSVDNIPGVPGIGIKTASLLINEYGDLDNLLEKSSNIKQNKRRESLIEFADQARLSRELVTLKEDIELPIPIENIKIQSVEPIKLISFLKGMEFKTLTEKKAREFSLTLDEIKTENLKLDFKNEKEKSINLKNEIDINKFNYEKYSVVQDLKELEDWKKNIDEKGYVAVDTETDSLNAIEANLVGFSMATDINNACYIPLKHDDSKKQINFEDAISILKSIAEDKSITKIFHNKKYDALVLDKYGIKVNSYEDTMLISYSLGSGGTRHGLDNLAKNYLSHSALSYKDIVGTGKNQKSFNEIDIYEATRYAAEDADITFRLWKLLKPMLALEKTSSVYEAIERPLASIIMNMEKNGVCIDESILKKLSIKFENDISKIENECFKIVGNEFNLGSPKQIGEILFDKLKIKGGKKTPSGAWSTDAETLNFLASSGNTLPRLLLEWRGLSKLKSTYTDALPTFVNKKTKRIHTSYSMSSTSTGRLSSSDPNLQNIPIKNSEGRMIRSAFIADKGYSLISADYSQIELRIIAHISDDHNLKDAFRNDIDIHSLTASEVFGIPLKNMDQDTRRKAKAINFGIIYGISAFGLSNQLDISRSEASDYIRSYFEKFPSIKDYMETTKEFAKENGYVKTLFGRKCIIDESINRGPGGKAFMERAAINAPIQGTAADIIKRAMIKIPKCFEKENLKTKMIMQVHDELIFETKDGEIEKTLAIVIKEMSEAHRPVVDLSVDLKVEAAFGKNWDQAH
ncbi:MAG: DNA polymerase I [Rhizobiales bacterium TMED168]|nr:MAG: DNA polymerase I [Rhizobiales bacterium TMED168]|tara:strand:- start:114649 stop:117447 length:2799 start_codon:yes stop_codon:yes gene_type:complete